MPNIIEKYYTIPQACNILGLKEHSLRRAIKDKVVPAYKPFGERVRVLISEIVIAIEETRNV